MSSSRKRKGDPISPTANKRRKITNSISTNNNNNNNIDNNNNNNLEIDQINSKPQIKRPPRNIRIKVTQNGFVIVPKPMRNNTKTFILEVVSKTEKDENNKAILGLQLTGKNYLSIENVLEYIYKEKIEDEDFDNAVYYQGFYWSMFASYCESIHENRLKKPNVEKLKKLEMKQMQLLDWIKQMGDEKWVSCYAGRWAMEFHSINIEHINSDPDDYGIGPFSTQCMEHVLKVLQLLYTNHSNNQLKYYHNIFYRFFHLTYDGTVHLVNDLSRRSSDINFVEIWSEDIKRNWDYKRLENKYPLFVKICEAMEEHEIGKQVPDWILNIKCDVELRKKIREAAESDHSKNMSARIAFEEESEFVQQMIDSDSPLVQNVLQSHPDFMVRKGRRNKNDDIVAIDDDESDEKENNNDWNDFSI